MAQFDDGSMQGWVSSGRNPQISGRAEETGRKGFLPEETGRNWKKLEVTGRNSSRGQNYWGLLLSFDTI